MENQSLSVNPSDKDQTRFNIHLKNAIDQGDWNQVQIILDIIENLIHSVSVDTRDKEKVQYTVDRTRFNISLKDAMVQQDWNQVQLLLDGVFPVDDFVYQHLFITKYPWGPLFNALLASKQNNLIRYFIRTAPLSCLTNSTGINFLPLSYLLTKPKCSSSFQEGIGYIRYVFYYDQKNIPEVLKFLSEEKRADVIIDDEYVQLIEKSIQTIIKTGEVFPQGLYYVDHVASAIPQDYFEAMESIDKYCVQVANNGYQIKDLVL